MQKDYEVFVEKLEAGIYEATGIPRENIHFEKEGGKYAPVGDRLLVKFAEHEDAWEVCGLYTQELFKAYQEGSPMEEIMKEWKKMDFKPDGVYTGFLAGARQVDVILKFVEMFCTKETHILIDPVMGDQGNVYRTYSEELCEKMRTLVQQATVITPNLTEALLLLHGEQGMRERMEAFSHMGESQELKEIEQLGKELAHHFRLESIVITGVDVLCEDGSVKMGNLVIEKDEADWYFSIKEGGSYSGTGDLFASVLSAGIVKGISMKECVQKAIAFLTGAIHDAVLEGTDRNDGVCFEKYLKML